VGAKLSDAVENEVAALTPEPASSDGWNQRDWALHYREQAKALQMRIAELETEAGIRAKVERLEDGPLFPNTDFRPYNPKAEAAEREHQKGYYRLSLRRIYFSVEDENLRKRLIALDRAESSAAFRFHEFENRAQHQAFADLEERVWPWVKIAVIDAVAASFICALIGHAVGMMSIVRQFVGDGATQIGAIMGAAAGVIDAIRLRDHAQHARAKAVADAREMQAENDRIYQSILDEPETFSAWEEFTGKPKDRDGLTA
jgi:hypothetical protein